MGRGRYLPHRVTVEPLGDGALRLTSDYPLGAVADTVCDWLEHWTRQTPDAVFLAERSGAGWRSISYVEAAQRARCLAAGLVARGLGRDTPILILTGNSIDHALLTLAGYWAACPVVPVAPQYAALPEAHPRLAGIVRTISPGAVYAGEDDALAPALTLGELQGVPRLRLRALEREGASEPPQLPAITPDDVAKILMTSGSTSEPKGVLITHRMLCTNQAQSQAVMPFTADPAPVLLDWLPWNHAFGGNATFNLVLSTGGTLYIDDGRPTPDLFARSLENLRMTAPTLSYNVPAGYAMLLEAMRDDAPLRRRFFGALRLIFYAAASMPPDIWDGLREMALETTGAVPLMTSGWGLTETGPSAITAYEPNDGSGLIGVPLPQVDTKLLPIGDNRYDVRLRGPNITPGYYRNTAKTAEAFDEQGYFMTGDTVSFADPDAPQKGLRFEGRQSEEFKLSTGSWVRAEALRLRLLKALYPLVSDLVVTGEGRAEIGLMLFLNGAACAGAGLAGAPLRSEIAARLAGLRGGSRTTHVARALILTEPPSIALGEVTPKGSLNTKRILANRAAELARLYGDGEDVIHSRPDQ